MDGPVCVIAMWLKGLLGRLSQRSTFSEYDTP